MLSGSRAQGEGDLSEGVEKGERVRQMQRHAAHRAHHVGAQLQQSLAQHPDLRPRTLRAYRPQPYLLHEYIGHRAADLLQPHPTLS